MRKPGRDCKLNPMSTPDSNLLALIKLLADDHAEVVETARTKLTELGSQAVPHLEKAAESDPDPKVRVEARGVLERIRLSGVGLDWEAAASQPDARVDLEKGAFLLAKVCYPELDPAPYLKRLDEMAETVRPQVKAAEKPLDRLKALNRFLFSDQKFRGNWDDYFDPQNSYLNRVLDRKLGIPISLSVLYLLIARRLRMPLKGVGIPGHFMVKYQDKEAELYIDTFNGGRFLSRAECIQFMVEAGYPYQPEFMEGVGPREILARMLRNLILIYVDRHEQTLGKTLTRFLDLLYPEKEESGRRGLGLE